jgi:phosphoserine aminotransferase
MKRVYNFSPGPAMLPTVVLERMQAELLDWQGSGMSVMEVSHRGSAFIEFAAQSEKNLRALLNVPANYKVLFLQGGATLQFAAVPLNLAPAGSVVDYAVTGNWSEKAVGEAKRYAEVNIVANSSATKFTTIPAPSTWKLSKNDVPSVSDAPLVTDMSSNFLSRPIDVSRFGVIYAGAQKNVGPAGLAIVIVREDLLGRARKETPGAIDFKTMAANDSMWNTPPTLSWYVAGLVFEWLLEQGGLAAIAKINESKAKKLYAAIDGSGFYKNPVEKSARSRMNVPFTLADPKLDEVFLKESKAAGLTNLKGHRVVGGMRASIYNAMPEAGVDALIGFMADFQKRKG